MSQTHPVALNPISDDIEEEDDEEDEENADDDEEILMRTAIFWKTKTRKMPMRTTRKTNKLGARFQASCCFQTAI